MQDDSETFPTCIPWTWVENPSTQGCRNELRIILSVIPFYFLEDRVAKWSGRSGTDVPPHVRGQNPPALMTVPAGTDGWEFA